MWSLATRPTWHSSERRESNARQRNPTATGASPPTSPRNSGPPTWKEQLLETLLEISAGQLRAIGPALLREAGFISATVTGKSGDGGIDGIGVYRLSLVSFPVFFQCKRYRGSVGAGAVRDFRGAMSGRGDKGLLITTGSFTTDAKGEATRDGAPPVDLIDGERLCDLSRNTSSACAAPYARSRRSRSRRVLFRPLIRYLAVSACGGAASSAPRG